MYTYMYLCMYGWKYDDGGWAEGVLREQMRKREAQKSANADACEYKSRTPTHKPKHSQRRKKEGQKKKHQLRLASVCLSVCLSASLLLSLSASPASTPPPLLRTRQSCAANARFPRVFF